jgi:hypothetical protein
VFIRFKSKKIRNKRVIILIKILIREPKYTARVFWLIW